jgi:hypothetical protein
MPHRSGSSRFRPASALVDAARAAGVRVDLMTPEARIRVNIVPEDVVVSAWAIDLIDHNEGAFESPEELMAMVQSAISLRHPCVEVRRRDDLAAHDARQLVYYVFPFGTAAPPPFVVVDDGGLCLDASPSALSLMGIDRDSAIGRHLATAPSGVDMRLVSLIRPPVPCDAGGRLPRTWSVRSVDAPGVAAP